MFLHALLATLAFSGPQRPFHTPARSRSLPIARRAPAASGISALLPGGLDTPKAQLSRARRQFDGMSTNLQKYLFLRELEKESVDLYYAFVSTNLLDCLPVIYTPTVGEACEKYSELYRTPKGAFITHNDKGRIREVLDGVPMDDVHIIVVTDGGRILGLGDLGANGMGIPIGKIALYVAGGGFDPRHALPVTLDLGTNNQKLLDDPLYIGARHPRLPDDEYFEIVDEFLAAVKDKWPKCLVQFEDFSTRHAVPLLDKYRSELLCFNDDIQGTGSVVLAGLINALKIQGTRPQDARIVFYGAGSAAVGCAETIVAMLKGLGVSELDAYDQFYMLDSKGLLTADRPDVEEMMRKAPHKLPFLRADVKRGDQVRLLDVIRQAQPHVLMGLSGNPGAFGEAEVRAMHAANPKPVICALSNPTAKAECSAENAYRWTGGDAIFASGSPFAPVKLAGRTLTPGQGNNMLVFPGVGRGAFLASAREVTDTMFIDAASCLAAMVEENDLDRGLLYPPLNNLLGISSELAAKTMDNAIRSGQSSMQHPGYEGLRDYVKANAWTAPHRE